MQLPMINDKNINNNNNNNQNNNNNNNQNNNNNNQNNMNNWFKIESRANVSGFLEDSEFGRKNTHGFLKKN